MFSIITGNISTIVSNLLNDIRNGFSSTISNIVSKLSETLASINLPQRFEDFTTDIRNAFGSIGGWFKAIGETGKDVFRYIGDVMKATFSWDTIKNSALSMIENFCNFFVDAINSLIPDWFSKVPGLKEVKGIARVSLTDGTATNPYSAIKGITVAANSYEKVESETKTSSFAAALSTLSDKIGALSSGEESDWSGIARQFSDLLSPVFEEYTKESKTIGQTLAAWTQKSSAEYLRSSKESFSPEFRT